MSWLRKSIVTAVSLIAAGTLFAGVAQAQHKVKIRVGQVAPIALFWPDFIAQQKGFYAAEGLDVESNFLGSVSAIVQQIIGNSIDVGFTTAETAIRAADKGGDVIILGETVYKWPYSFMAARDIKKPQDLKGKKVILAEPKQDLVYLWDEWLHENGMKSSDVDQVFDGATPNRYAALVAGAVQCAVVSQPFDFKAIQEGYTQLFDTSFMKKHYSFVVVAARRKWTHDNPKVAAAFMRAIGKAIAWWYDPKNKEEAVDILQKVSKQKRPLIIETYDYYHNKVQPYPKDAKLQPDGFKNLLDALVQADQIKKRPASFYTDPNPQS
jgi:ABC-type nitrate/sulfonate/bicarbonate transport system substrate-binding protein